ncbi:MAG: ATP-binding protein [Planctomycetota bacterium]
MERLSAESLLLLARSETDGAAREPVDLDAAMCRAFAPFAGSLERRHVSIRHDASSNGGVIATAVPALVERVAADLASNAAAYATPGSTVEVETSVAGDRVRVTVANDCEPLPADAAERAFEPFWRADAARTDQGVHAGLGLALVRSCVEAMDGDAAIDASANRFEISVALPR